MALNLEEDRLAVIEKVLFMCIVLWLYACAKFCQICCCVQKKKKRSRGNVVKINRLDSVVTVVEELEEFGCDHRDYV